MVSFGCGEETRGSARPAGPSWRTVLGLGLALLPFSALTFGTLGCNAILDIEDRSLDETPLEAEGYEGCVPKAGDCDECISEWHRCTCEEWEGSAESGPERSRFLCAQKAPSTIRSQEVREATSEYHALKKEQGEESRPGADSGSSVPEEEESTPETPPEENGLCGPEPAASDCLSCLCDNCEAAILRCEERELCRRVFTCVALSGCEFTGAADNKSCFNVCNVAIAAAGGLDSKPFAEFEAAVSCGQEEGCPCGAEGPRLPTCPDNDCSQCENCWSECQCNGSTLVDCQAECGDPMCLPGNDCSQCNDCLDECLCIGDLTPGQCLQECGP